MKRAEAKNPGVHGRAADGACSWDRHHVCERHPMTWNDLSDKFKASAERVIGKTNAVELFDAARNFGKPGTLQTMLGLLEEKNLLQPRPQ